MNIILQNLIHIFNEGKYLEAKKLAQKFILENPRHMLAYKILSAACEKLGKVDEGVEILRLACIINPTDSETHFDLARMLLRSNRYEEAIDCLNNFIKIMPNSLSAHVNFGNLLAEIDRLEEAEIIYRKAIAINEVDSLIKSNLGIVLSRLNRKSEAEVFFREATILSPKNAMHHLHLGNILIELGRLLDAKNCYQKAMALDPNDPLAYLALGQVLIDLDRTSEAEECFKNAITLNPNLADAHAQLGSAFTKLDRIREAERCYRKSLEINPDHYPSLSNLIFLSNYHDYCQHDKHYNLVIEYRKVVRKLITTCYTKWNLPEKNSKLKIGFVSGDFRRHSVGYFLKGLLSNLNKAAFDLFAYPTSNIQDEVTEIFKTHFSQWTPLTGFSNEQAAKVIHMDGLNILIDLSGHTIDNMLPVFAYKPAPIQISWLGYCGATGLSEIDYILGDPYVTPLTNEKNFAEGIWRLPETYLAYSPPDEDIQIGSLPAIHNGFVTFGSFNNLSKINDRVLSVWSQVLSAIPGSKLFIKSNKIDHKEVTTKTIQRFASFGINSERLIIEKSIPSYIDHLMTYNYIDISLDTFPYPGVTTSAESLWMGVPVLTLRGDCFISRNGEAIAHNSGQADWIATDCSDYIRKAIYFSSDLNKLSAVRSRLRSQVMNSPFFDTKKFALNFERALMEMIRQKT